MTGAPRDTGGGTRLKWITEKDLDQLVEHRSSLALTGSAAEKDFEKRADARFRFVTCIHNVAEEKEDASRRISGCNRRRD